MISGKKKFRILHSQLPKTKSLCFCEFITEAVKMIVHVSRRKYSLRDGSTSVSPNTDIRTNLCLLKIMNNKWENY
jgi:hypothetical protein